MRAALQAHPDVPAWRQLRLGRVDADANANFDALRPHLLRVRALRFDGGGNGVLGTWKRDEERLALRVHFASALAADRVAHELVVAGEHPAVRRTESLEQARRSLDVGEDERHSPNRELRRRHGRIVARR